MSHPPAMDYSHNTYLSITFPRSSPFYSSPTSFHPAHSSSSTSASQQGPTLTYVSPVGELPDAHIYAVQGVVGGEWERVREQVLGGVKGQEGVGRVEELKARTRAKRGGDEL